MSSRQFLTENNLSWSLCNVAYSMPQIIFLFSTWILTFGYFHTLLLKFETFPWTIHWVRNEITIKPEMKF